MEIKFIDLSSFGHVVSEYIRLCRSIPKTQGAIRAPSVERHPLETKVIDSSSLGHVAPEYIEFCGSIPKTQGANS